MAYVISLGAGLLAGLLYGLLGVRSPAPPAIALVGLLGMLLGEQAAPIGKRIWAGQFAAGPHDPGREDPR